MVKRGTVALLVCLMLVGFASCGDEKPTQTHEYTVAGKDFQMQGCTWNLSIPETLDLIYSENDDGSEGTPYYPDLGYFYVISANISPTENPFCNPRFLRFELIDVHGNRYFPTNDSDTIGVYEKKTGLKNLSGLSEIKADTEAFIMIDAPGSLTGLTLALIYTGQEPELKLYEVDLKR